MSAQKALLCPFHCKPRPSGVPLESRGLKNIGQVPGNRTEVDQNHDARNAVSATVSVLKWSGLYFGPEAPKWAFKKFFCVLWLKNKAITSSFSVPGTGNSCPSSGKSSWSWSKSRCSQSGLCHPFRLKVKCSYISVQKLESERSKSFAVSISVQTKAIKVSLGSPGLENIPQVPGDPPEVCQNHNARKVVSVTL